MLELVKKAYEREFAEVAKKWRPEDPKPLLLDIMKVIENFMEANELS